MRVLYIDSLFMLELVADVLLLWAAGKLCGVRRRWFRLVLAGALGAGYAVLAALWLPAAAWLGKAAALAAMLLVGYGGEKRLWRLALAFLFLCAVYGGVSTAVTLTAGRTTFRALLFALGVSLGVCALPFRFSGKKGGTAALRLVNGGVTCRFFALLDSGNSLREPISGEAAAIAAEAALLPLLDAQSQRTLRESGGLSAAERLVRLGPGFRLLPYRSLDGGGLLLAFKPEQVYVDDEPVSGLWVALSPEPIRAPGGCDALLGAAWE